MYFRTVRGFAAGAWMRLALRLEILGFPQDLLHITTMLADQVFRLLR